MNGKRHKPPSRIRYENNNPVFSVRMPKAWHDRLNQMLEASNQSRKDFLAQALGIKTGNSEPMKQQDFIKGYKEGYKEGYKNGRKFGHDEGKKKCIVALSCYKCEKMVDIPLPAVYDALVKFSKDHRIYVCPECEKKY